MMQKECVIEDFAPEGIDIARLLVWFDRYPCNVETKGGMMPLMVNKFIVTSNFSIDDVYPGHVQLPALRRRINEILMD